MAYMLPQEIQVWYIIPVLRKELTRYFINELGVSQKETARKLSLTEAAVSQYISGKRGSNIKLDKALIEEIGKSAEEINRHPENIIEEMMRLLELEKVRKIVCDIHKKTDPRVRKGCSICDDVKDK